MSEKCNNTFSLMLRTVVFVLGSFLPGAWASVFQPEPDRLTWLNTHAVPLRTIDIYDKDLSDLAPLKAAIGDAQIVLLGEQTHGDGASFAAKSRLIKFLHREMNFEVLAWESGMEEMRRLDEAFAKGEPVERAHAIGLFGIWSLSQQCQELLQYIRKERTGEHPLLTAGFDDQVTTDPSLTPFPTTLIEFFDAADAKLLSPAQRAAPAAIYKWLSAQANPDKPDQPPELDDMRSLLPLIAQHRAALDARHTALEVSFRERAIGNVINYIERTQKGFPEADIINHRDQRMADNLVFLANDYFKGKKIIVWAASMHNARRVEPLEWIGMNHNYKGVRPMGDFAWDTLGPRMYSIMFTAYQGRIGRPWSGPSPIETAKPDTLESLLHDTGKPYLFLDFRSLPKDHWLRTPITARPLGYAPMKGIWPDSFDAVLFTDRMYPSTPVGREPEDARPPPRR